MSSLQSSMEHVAQVILYTLLMSERCVCLYCNLFLGIKSGGGVGIEFGEQLRDHSLFSFYLSCFQVSETY
jgi:hypothetical protein